MTMAQMTVAIAAVAVIIYRADAIRGGMLITLLLVILLFVVLRLTTVELLAMGGTIVGRHALVIVLLTTRKSREQIEPSVEWTQ